MEKPDGSEPAPIISHEEIHTKIPSISQNVSDQGHVYYNNVTTQPSVNTPSTAVVLSSKQPIKKPKDFVIFSCFVILSCNFIFGFIGYHFGQKSSYAWQLGDVDTAKRQAKKALIFNVIGIIVGLLTYILALVLFFTVFNGVVPEVKHHAVG